MPFVKSLAKGSNSLASLTTMLMLLLIATSVPGFSSSSSSSSSSYLTPYAGASPISMNAAAAATATTTPITYTIKLGEEPFALGRYTPVSQTMIDKTLQQQHLKLVFEGSTTITLPKQCLIERVKAEHFKPEQFLL
jgi:hypothetical protein